MMTLARLIDPGAAAAHRSAPLVGTIETLVGTAIWANAETLAATDIHVVVCEKIVYVLWLGVVPEAFLGTTICSENWQRYMEEMVLAAERR